jgi:hypothetical protein
MLDAAPDPGLSMCESVCMRVVVTDRAEGSCQRERERRKGSLRSLSPNDVRGKGLVSRGRGLVLYCLLLLVREVPLHAHFKKDLQCACWRYLKKLHASRKTRNPRG